MDIPSCRALSILKEDGCFCPPLRCCETQSSSDWCVCSAGCVPPDERSPACAARGFRGSSMGIAPPGLPQLRTSRRRGNWTGGSIPAVGRSCCRGSLSRCCRIEAPPGPAGQGADGLRLLPHSLWNLLDQEPGTAAGRRAGLDGRRQRGSGPLRKSNFEHSGATGCTKRTSGRSFRRDNAQLAQLGNRGDRSQ